MNVKVKKYHYWPFVLAVLFSCNCYHSDTSSNGPLKDGTSSPNYNANIELDSFSISAILKIASHVSENLDSFVDPPIINPDVTFSAFDFFTRTTSNNSSLEERYYHSYSSVQNKWSIYFSNKHYTYKYRFTDTINLSIGFLYVTLYDSYNNIYVERRAPGFVILFNRIRVAYFVGIYQNKYAFDQITSILLLDQDLYPLRRIHYGRRPLSPPAAEFISEIEYDSNFIYRQEQINSCIQFIRGYDSASPFSHLVYPLSIRDSCDNRKVITALVTPSLKDVNPIFWITQSLIQ